MAQPGLSPDMKAVCERFKLIQVLNRQDPKE